jgi:thioester reductase-like protein
VNGLFSYEMLRGANVEGTVTAIRLAGLGGAHLVYVSSTSALVSSKEGQEGAPPLAVKRIGRISSGYGKSKRVSEHLVMSAQEKGLSASIVRPGTIGPVAGWNDNDTLTKLFRGMLQMQLAPGVASEISVAPVDWVAEVAVAAASVAHVVLNTVGNPVWFDGLAPSALKRVPLAEFVSRITRDNALAPLLSYFDNGVFPLGNDNDYVSSTATIQFALSRGVRQCPAWSPPLDHLQK